MAYIPDVMAYINNALPPGYEALAYITKVTRSIPSASAYIANASPHISNDTAYITSGV
jgi:hypothetical protein